jgi:hypothetical protein
MPCRIYDTVFHSEQFLKDYVKFQLHVMLNAAHKQLVRGYSGLIPAKMTPSAMFSRNCRCQVLQKSVSWSERRNIWTDGEADGMIVIMRPV